METLWTIDLGFSERSVFRGWVLEKFEPGRVIKMASERIRIAGT